MSQAGQAQDILLDLMPEDYQYTSLSGLAVDVAGRVEEVERQRDALAEMLDSILSTARWSERLTIRPVPWEERTVDVARGVAEVAELEEWTRRYLEIAHPELI